MNAISTIKLTKKFGDFIANDQIDLSIEKGEITAIVGENGAGKTTLMNMFYGLLKPTSGEILINGQRADFRSPQDAICCGLGMVHQHFKLVPSLTVFENILLGTEIQKEYFKVGKHSVKSPFIDYKEEKKRVQRLITDYKFELDAGDKVENISIGAAQRVEILKMLYRNVDILIFDEPTAVLTPQEVDALLYSLKEMKAQGKTIIIITHKLREIMEVSDKAIVIKKGKVVGSVTTAETNPKELANMMVGRDVVLSVEKKGKAFENEQTVYRAECLKTKNDLGKTVVDNVSFSIKKGEILGIAGVEGNGQSELVKLLTGLMCSLGGKVYINEKDITNKWPDELRRNGIAMIPEDRYTQGLCREMSISDNLISGYHSKEQYCRHGILKRKEIENDCDALIEAFDIRISKRKGNVSQLSGGNAQKIIIAKEFHADPVVLIASQPTRGVDVGSIEFIYKKLLEFRDKGKAILLVSSELSEIMSLSDRIIVMYKGRVVGEVDAKTATKEKLGLLMAGIAGQGGEA